MNCRKWYIIQKKYILLHFLMYFPENYHSGRTINFHEQGLYSLQFHLSWVIPGNILSIGAFPFHLIHFNPQSPALLIYFLMSLNHFPLSQLQCSNALLSITINHFSSCLYTQTTVSSVFSQLSDSLIYSFFVPFFKRNGLGQIP